MSEDLKKETTKGVAWSGVDKIANGGLQFVANIVLARLLAPSDFGLLAIIGIFVQISKVFIDSGFSNALIQKKDRSQADYSTVFIFNLVLSVGIYIILFFFAPFIADFFDNERLISLTRAIGISLIIGALISVHKTKLIIQLQFRIQALISLISSFISAIVSIWMAYYGYGVWSLVALSITNITIQVILIYIMIKWRPTLLFSTTVFKKLFSYSSKLLCASLIHLLYRNIYPIVIGKIFNPVQLGYFNRADTLAMYPSNTVGNVISRVAFPIFSRIQDDNTRLRDAYSKYIIYASLLIFPMMIGLLVLAKPLTLWILSEKWLPMVPMLQILCLDWMGDHICTINLNVLYVKGRSDLALRLEIIKKIIAIVIFVISLYWGLIGVCWGRLIYGVFAIYINSFYTKILIGISLSKQIKDIALPFFCAVLMGVILFFYTLINWSNWVLVCSGIPIGIIMYILILYIINKEYIKEFKFILSSVFKINADIDK